MKQHENRKLARVQYWKGQMLRSSDFLDIQRIEAQRRWWHNRALHRAYGVYQGLQASSGKGLPVINVTPGVAYDCFGRELLLECSASVLLPAAPSQDVRILTLLIRYRGMECRDVTDDSAAVCCLAGGPSSAGTVEFAWSANPKTSPDEGIPLGRLLYKGRQLLRFIAFVTAPSHRPLARPRLGSGSTVPGNTSWQPWDYTTVNSDGFFSTEIGVQTTINTSAAGLTEIPQYFAWLQGSPWNAQTLQLAPALLPSLADESINSFTFRLILLPPPQNTILEARTAAASLIPKITFVRDSSAFAVFAQQQKLYVSWLACQMPPRTQFVPQRKVTCNKVFQPEVSCREA